MSWGTDGLAHIRQDVCASHTTAGLVDGKRDRGDGSLSYTIQCSPQDQPCTIRFEIHLENRCGRDLPLLRFTAGVQG